jgi:hypothetical protein
MTDNEDKEDTESFEEYTWAGQTRVRASSMVEGGLGGKTLHLKRGMSEYYIGDRETGISDSLNTLHFILKRWSPYDRLLY